MDEQREEDKRPLTQAELEQIAENLFLDSDDDSNQESGSETEDALEFDDFEDSGSEYVPSEDESRDESSPPRTKKLRLSHKEQNDGKTVDDQITVDYSLPGSSRSNESELLQGHRAPGTETRLQRRIVRVDETIRSQVRLVGKNGHRWSAVPKSASRTPQRNILHIFPGPVTNFQNDLLANEFFKLFITDSMIDKIVLHTNAMIRIKSGKYKTKSATISTSSPIEIRALLGLLVLSAYLKSNHLSSKELFDDKICGAVYKAVMSRERFKFLLDCLRFDNKDTRDERRLSEKFGMNL